MGYLNGISALYHETVQGEDKWQPAYSPEYGSHHILTCCLPDHVLSVSRAMEIHLGCLQATQSVYGTFVIAVKWIKANVKVMNEWIFNHQRADRKDYCCLTASLQGRSLADIVPGFQEGPHLSQNW